MLSFVHPHACIASRQHHIDFDSDAESYSITQHNTWYMCQYVLNISSVRGDIEHKANYSIGFHNRYAIMYPCTPQLVTCMYIICVYRSNMYARVWCVVPCRAVPCCTLLMPRHITREDDVLCRWCLPTSSTHMLHSLCLRIDMVNCVKCIYVCLQSNANNLDTIEIL